MRKGLHAWVIALVGLAECFAQTPAAQSDGKQKILAAPPTFTKRFYRAPGGQFYVPAGVPVKLSIGLATDGGGTDSADASNSSAAVLKEGPNSLQFGDAKVPAIADGTPPKTVLEVVERTQIEHGGLRVLAPNPKIRITATDLLSGVFQTLISVDGATFEPLPPGGPEVKTEGEHRLRYFSVDHVGNVEKIQDYDFRIDAAPPMTQLEVSGPKAGDVVGVGASISLHAQDEYAGVLMTRYSLDDAADSNYERPLQLDGLPEGQHHFEYQSADGVGNVEKSHDFAFRIDRQPPEISLAIHGPLYRSGGVRYVSIKSQVELTADDAVAGPMPVRFGLDEEMAAAYKAPFPLPAISGIHRLRVESEDPVRNTALVTVNDIYVDLTPPKTEMEFSRPFFTRGNVTVLNPFSRITLNADDFESGVAGTTYSIDGGPEQNYSEPFSIPEEGEHRVSVASFDHVGNREAPLEVRVVVEPSGNIKAPPSTLDARRWYLHPKLGLIGPPDLPFVLRIADKPDAGAQNFLIVEDPTLAPADQQGPLTFTIPGPNRLKIGITREPETFAVAIDALPPKTQLNPIGAHRAESGGVTFFGPGLKIALVSQDDPSGVSSGLWKTLYSLDGSPFTTYTAPIDTFLREGAYSLRYYALDNVGNAEKAQVFEFTVDSSPPKTLLELRGPHLAGTVSPATRIAFAATDNLSGVAQVQYRIDEGGLSTYGEPFPVGKLSEGPHRLHYFAVDAAGNREEEHTWRFMVQSRVDAASFEVEGLSVEHGASIYVAPGSHIVLKAPQGATVEYAFDGAPPQTYSNPIPIPDTGTHKLSFHAVDGVQNVSATQVLSLTTDRTPPQSRVRFEGPQMNRGPAPIIGGGTKVILDSNGGAVGGATVEYSLNGLIWQSYTGPFTIKNSGTLELYFRGANPLARVEPVQKQRVVVDAQGPVVSVSYSAPASSSGGMVELQSGTLIFIDAADVPAGVDKITYRIDGQSEFIYRSPLSGFAPGTTHTLEIAAQDLLGNQTEKTVRFRIKEPGR